MKYINKNIYNNKIVRSILIVLAIGVFLSSYSVNAKNSESLNTVYHLYIDGESFGTVTDNKVVDTVIKQKQRQFKKVNANIKGALSNKIEYVPETIFGKARNLTNTDELVTKLDKTLNIKTTVAALYIDGKEDFLFEKVDHAEQVLEQLKIEKLGLDQVRAFEATKSGNKLIGASAIEGYGETITEISFDKTVELKEIAVTPTKIYTPEEALNIIRNGSVAQQQYTVQTGDVFGKIAENFGLTTQELVNLNPTVTADKLKVGQVLVVTGVKPLLQVKVTKEVKKLVSIPYETQYVDDNSMFKGTTKISQKGVEGAKESAQVITEINGSVIDTKIISEIEVVKPTTQIVLKGTKIVPSRGSGELAWPCVGGYVSSNLGYRWGAYHKGLDIARPSNYTIKAADNGTVTFAGWDSGYGNKIEINHNNGLKTVYAHLKSLSVSSGQVVSKGQQIGVMGSTGNSTGVHLHFEVYENGALRNPLNYVSR
ncbi:MAG: peptidase [Bacillales bacterium]|jgi:murein DD-endopeptidase MepM/ murein hydrolase activator NlpD|nr:peptidase [Bacillales bacterium]